jgi:hypothetical protein
METKHEINGVPGTLTPYNADGSGADWASDFRQIGNVRMQVYISYARYGRNKHASFSATAEIRRACGCLHDEIREHFPELAPLVRFHLFDDTGPLHYIANTKYWAAQGEIAAARKSACWPDATEEQLLSDTALNARLPALLDEFRAMLADTGMHMEPAQ